MLSRFLMIGLFLPGFLFAQPLPPSPNVVFILVDDLGWADLGCYGSTYYETPNLDRLAAEGLRFTQAYAASPVCSPTRAAIMTGKHPARLKITDWIPGQDPRDRPLLGPRDLHELPLGEITLAEAFRSQGYATFYAGKWHLGDVGHLPQDQGFDINKGGHDKGSPPGGYYAPYQNPQLEDGPEGEYLPDRLTDESIAFVQDNADRPFFLYLAFYTVHTPIQASRRHIDYYAEKKEGLPNGGEPRLVTEHEGQTLTNQVNADYASMVAAMDENVGRLLKALEDEGVGENTIIIFTSDNGGLSTLGPGRVAPTSVRPLRAGKGWAYEGGIRVPLIIRTPDMPVAGQTTDVPVISHDLYPTALYAAGLGVPSDQLVDGRPLTPLLRGEYQAGRPLWWHFPHYHGSTWTPGSAVRDGDWKLIEFFHWNTVELYNLEEDPGETNNLMETHPVKAQEMLDLLHRFQAQAGAQMPVPNPEFKE